MVSRAHGRTLVENLWNSNAGNRAGMGGIGSFLFSEGFTLFFKIRSYFLKIFKKKFISLIHFILCVNDLATYMSVYRVCLVPEKAREGIRSLGTGAIDDCELPRGCWASNPGLQEQQVLLTSELFLQVERFALISCFYILLLHTVYFLFASCYSKVTLIYPCLFIYF